MAFDDPFYVNTSNTDDDQSNTFYNFNDEDPAAEFLEREKRELGDITGNEDGNSYSDPFSTTSPNNNLFTNGNYFDRLFVFFYMILFRRSFTGYKYRWK
jgi:hypothetical protein